MSEEKNEAKRAKHTAPTEAQRPPYDRDSFQQGVPIPNTDTHVPVNVPSPSTDGNVHESADALPLSSKDDIDAEASIFLRNFSQCQDDNAAWALVFQDEAKQEFSTSLDRITNEQNDNPFKGETNADEARYQVRCAAMSDEKKEAKKAKRTRYADLSEEQREANIDGTWDGATRTTNPLKSARSQVNRRDSLSRAQGLQEQAADVAKKPVEMKPRAATSGGHVEPEVEMDDEVDGKADMSPREWDALSKVPPPAADSVAGDAAAEVAFSEKPCIATDRFGPDVLTSGHETDAMPAACSSGCAAAPRRTLPELFGLVTEKIQRRLCELEERAIRQNDPTFARRVSQAIMATGEKEDTAKTEGSDSLPANAKKAAAPAKAETKNKKATRKRAAPEKKKATSEDAKQTKRAKDRAYQGTRRATMAKEKKEAVNEKQRKYERARCAAQSEEEKEAVNEKQREYDRARRAAQSEEEREAVNKKQRKYDRVREAQIASMRARWASQSEKQREAVNERQRARHATLSEEERETQRAKWRKYYRARRAALSEEEREAANEKQRKYKRARLAALSEEEREAVKEKKRKHERARRAAQSEEEKEARRTKERARRRALPEEEREAERAKNAAHQRAHRAALSEEEKEAVRARARRRARTRALRAALTEEERETKRAKNAASKRAPQATQSKEERAAHEAYMRAWHAVWSEKQRVEWAATQAPRGANKTTAVNEKPCATQSGKVATGAGASIKPGIAPSAPSGVRARPESGTD